MGASAHIARRRDDPRSYTRPQIRSYFTEGELKKLV